MDIYTKKWINAVEGETGKERDEIGVRVLGKAGLEVLLAAAGTTRTMDVCKEITACFLVKLRQALNSKIPGTRDWLLKQADPISRVAIGKENGELAEAMVRVGMEFFLAVQQSLPDSDRGQLHKILLGICTPILEEIEQAALMNRAQRSIENLVDENFNKFFTEVLHKDRLEQLERDHSDILNSVCKAASHIPSLPATIAALTKKISACVEEARPNCI